MKGRHWLLVCLGVFLLIATAVLLRQQSSFEVAARLRTLREKHGALEARRAELERTIHGRSSAAALLPKVGRLGLELPKDTAFTIISVEPPDGNGRR